MLSQITVQLDQAKFTSSKVKSLSVNSQRLAILGVLNRAANTVPFVHFVPEASILDCSGPKVFAQLCYHTELSGKLLAALEKAKIQTVCYGNMGPVPDQAEIADLQAVLQPVAPSIQVLAIKGRSARFVISQSDLPSLQTVDNLEPNTSLRIRIPDRNGQWRCINPKIQPNETTASDAKSTPPGYVPDGGVIKLASHAPHGLAPDTQRGDSQVNIVPSPVSTASTKKSSSSIVVSATTQRNFCWYEHNFCWNPDFNPHETKDCLMYRYFTTCPLCHRIGHLAHHCPAETKLCQYCQQEQKPKSPCKCYKFYPNTPKFDEPR
jgi:hypothetical protein